MNRPRAARVALLAASALHLGFQATVTTVVYPALLDGPRSGLPAKQSPHVERLAPVTAAVYSALLGATAAAAVTGRRPARGRARGATLVSCTAAVVAPVLTGGVSTPLHVRVARGRTTPALVEGILVTDRVRTVVAAIGLISAVRSLV